jgi:sugar/nucleoside kinase (ribokinase family)
LKPERSANNAPGKVAPGVIVAGNVNVDLILGPQTPWPAPGSEVVLAHHDLRAGGAAGNVALALSALTTPCTLVAGCGSGPLGKWLQSAFAHLDVRWTPSERPCAVSVGVTHPDGERTFFTHLGHLEDDSPAPTLSALAGAVPGGALILLGAFLSPGLRQAQLTLLRAAQRHQLQTVLDPGWPPGGWSPQVCAEVTAWLPACDHLLINEAEVLGLGAQADLDAAVQVVRAALAPGATLVVKRGPAGARAWRGDEQVSVPAPSVTVVDTIGAGDTFNAGYLSAALRGESLSTCVQAGVAAASYAVSTSPRRYAPHVAAELAGR